MTETARKQTRKLMPENSQPMICSVYRSSRKEGMYLYLPKQEPFERVPETLMKRFGEPAHVMDILLRPERPLANADVGEVLVQVRDNGFYLQVPPTVESLLAKRAPGIEQD